ncbi:hypothetical protein KBY97_00405 [Synechococcus sp. ATX 2A4]|uniref:hypothetical protein n=1 Tax=Synechococcus sp. ATX 2A4 TaxID=2823727 RepID=UPI0020CD7485|nr:hypothetical protein [Synechococcus sp. ATX 2A4]MCP9883587.1 hypothetical protein [Synechococcus sp. ATX 2A4]
MVPALPGSPVQRMYRLVDPQGQPHPVLDEAYDSMEAAWEAACGWWEEQRGGPVGIGLEVSTGCGDWRTLRHPGC